MSSEIKPAIFLQGPNLYLRPLTEDDVDRLQRWICNPKVRVNIMNQWPLSRSQEVNWLNSLAGDKSRVVLAICLNDHTHIGVIELGGINYLDGTAVTGCIIGEENFHRKGYGHEAKMLLLSHAFLTLNLRKVCSQAKAFNSASLGFNAKCGYREEGRRKAQHYVNGEYVDEVLTAVFKEDWLPLWESFQQVK